MTKRVITEEIFKEKVGSAPENDDLERCNCDKAGEILHWGCGWCDDCDIPMFMCQCFFAKRYVKKHE